MSEYDFSKEAGKQRAFERYPGQFETAMLFMAIGRLKHHAANGNKFAAEFLSRVQSDFENFNKSEAA